MDKIVKNNPVGLLVCPTLKIVGAFVVAIFLLFGASGTMAESYAIYVDASADDDGNGSKDKPFKELKDAVKKAKSGENIYIAGGTYDGGFQIPASVGLYGQSRDGVKIRGPLTTSNGVTLKNLTVSGGDVAITVESGASVSVKKCTIRDAGLIGIDMQPGNGKLTVEDSKMTNNNKGIYAQKGNQLRVFGSVVTKSRGEGIDIRDNVDGSVTGNEIFDNGESGIEIILGSSDMTISGNAINGNSASGIATQFYSGSKKQGDVRIENNKIRNNNQFGIRCGVPSGGDVPDKYWEKSLNLQGNVFEGNKKGNFEGLCDITLDDEVAEEGEKEALVSTVEKEKIDPENEMVEEEISPEDLQSRKRITFFRLGFGWNDNIWANRESSLFLCKEKLLGLHEFFAEI